MAETKLKINQTRLQEVTQDEIAALLNLSLQTIQNYKRYAFPDEIGPFPEGKKGTGTSILYSWNVVYHWYIKHQIYTKYKDLFTNTASPTVEEGEDWKKRKERASALKEEMDLAEAQGKLLPAKEVEKAWSDAVLKIRAKLLTLPKRVSNLLFDGMTVGDREIVIEEEVREALTVLSESESNEG